MPVQGGGTVRDHLLSQQRQSKQVPSQLLPVECDESVKYLWGYWTSMNARRISPNPISSGELQAWASLRGIVFSQFELNALDAIESLYFELQPKK